MLAGEFAVINRHLVDDLLKLNLWTPSIRNEIIARQGSVQGIAGIPADLQLLYRTVWEIKQRSLVEMAADRGAYIDQSQSFNVHLPAPTYAQLTSLHFFAWKIGLKTGMYYLRTRPASDAIAFTVDVAMLKASKAKASAASADIVAESTLATEPNKVESKDEVCYMKVGERAPGVSHRCDGIARSFV